MAKTTYIYVVYSQRVTVLYCVETFRGWFVPRIYKCFIALPTNPLFHGVTHSIGGELSLPQGIP